jgi:TPR repeat protein
MSTSVADYEKRIKDYEKQVKEFTQLREEIKNNVSQKKQLSEELNKEKVNLEQSIKAIGFFRFKERKPLKVKLKEIRTRIQETVSIIYRFETDDSDLSKKIDDLLSNISSTKHAKELQEKNEKLEKLANEGDAQAQYEMGLRYKKSDYKDALRWLEKAANQGHNNAKNMINEINNEKLYFKVCNDLAWTLVEVKIYSNSVNTCSWQGRLNSSIDGGSYEPILCYVTRGVSESIYGDNIKVSVHYKYVFHNQIMPGVIEKNIRASTDSSYVDMIYIDKSITSN